MSAAMRTLGDTMVRTRMLRSQRILIIVVLLLIALMLHLSMCDWVLFNFVSMDSVQGYEHPRHASLLTFRHASPQYSKNTGLVSSVFVGRAEALLFGALVPILLIMLAAYLFIGAGHSSRAKRGLCLTCRYDLRTSPQPLAQCPECGTPATLSRA